MSRTVSLPVATFSTALLLAALGPTFGAAALGQGKGMGGSPFGGMSVDAPSRDEFRSFAVSTPLINLNGESIVHLELNLAGNATVALEGVMKRAFEEVDEEEMKLSGESRSSKASGGSLILSRYSRPMSMAGFYWSLGAGYRQETVSWKVRPDDKDTQVDLGLVGQDQRLHHEAELSGTTGHFRAGYRYVGQDWPLLAGIYLGARHFQAGVDDGKAKDEELQTGARTAPMTDREKERLRRKYSTRPDCGLEIGFRF